MDCPKPKRGIPPPNLPPVASLLVVFEYVCHVVGPLANTTELYRIAEVQHEQQGRFVAIVLFGIENG